MKLLTTIRVLVLSAMAVTCLNATASAAAFIKFDGVDGESSAVDLPGASDLLSWGFDLEAPDYIPRGREVSRVNMGDVIVTKHMDKATPKLYEACAKGKHFPSADITLRTSGDEPRTYLTYKLKDVLISSFSAAGTDSSERPTESLSLNFTKVEIIFYYPAPTGGPDEEITFGWDVSRTRAR